MITRAQAMHRLYMTLLLTVVLIPIVPRAESQPSTPLIVSQDHAWPPLAFRGENGNPQGLLVDLWQELSTHLEQPVSFRLVDWPDTLAQLRDGRAQVHGGLFPSPERDVYLEFSRPLLPLETVIFVAADRDDADLGASSVAPVGVVAGSYEREFLQTERPELALREYPNNDALVRAAARGELQAFAADHPVGLYLLARHTDPGQFHVREVLYRRQLVAAVPQGEQALLTRVNAAIEALDPETLTRIRNRWIHTQTVEVTPRWLLPALVGALLLLTLLFLGVYLRTLRSERTLLAARLEDRTRDLKERGQQFQALFDNAAVSVIVHDRKSLQALQANDQALTSFGVDSIEALNRAAFETGSLWSSPPYDLEQAREMFRKACEQGPQRFEWRARRSDGTEFWLDIFLQQISIGGQRRIVSTAIDITARKRAETRLHKQLQMEEQVREISVLLLSCGIENTGEGITRALARVGENMQCSRCTLLDYADGKQGFDLFQQWCAPGTTALPPDFHIPAVVIAPYVNRLKQGEAVSVNLDRTDEDTVEHALLEAGGARSVLGLPILRGDCLEGMLILSFPEPPRLKYTEIRPLQVVADLIGAAVTRQRLAGELQRQASHDSLTGMYNRRRFEELLQRELERAARYRRQFAVTLFDIDHFKQINDRHGHDVGDAVLRELTELIRQQLRDSDVPARWGGEEFLVMFPETDSAGAQQAAEALRRRIAEADYPGIPGQVTISLGVTEYRAGDSMDSLIKRADEALYRAKKEGRNRVVVG